MDERPHKKLKLWEKVMTVIEEVYHLTDTYPKQESYGLSMQMRRAAVSIASNIAEGAARKGKQEKIQFYSVARGSLSELDAQLEISARLKYVTAVRYGKSQLKLDEVSRMLQGMINAYKEPKS